MPNRIIYTSVFIHKAKKFHKKHPSLKNDLAQLEESLLKTPKQGNDLGGGLFKIRLAVESKGKGKSGGYRVITYILTQTGDEISINMLTIYDKSEEGSIDKKKLLQFIKELF